MILCRNAGGIAGDRTRPWSKAVFLLDTNVVSELRRPRPQQAVIDWISDVPADQLFVSAVTVGEIQAGIEITREQDASKAAETGGVAEPSTRFLQRSGDGCGRLP